MPDEHDFCRVCRSEGTADHPLFFPCKCAGSIKYIHQDCLIEWLRHSGKKSCELCKHPYSFSPIYAEQMPKRLPLHIIAWVLTVQLFRQIAVLLRYLLVAIVWLGIVPYVTSYTFRIYFDWSLLHAVGIDTSYEASYEDVLHSSLSVLFDCAQGLIITFVLVGIFLGLVLLRDYLGTQEMADQAAERQRQLHLARRTAAAAANTAGENAWTDPLAQHHNNIQQQQQNAAVSTGGAFAQDLAASSIPASAAHGLMRRPPIIASAATSSLFPGTTSSLRSPLTSGHRLSTAASIIGRRHQGNDTAATPEPQQEINTDLSSVAGLPEDLGYIAPREYHAYLRRKQYVMDKARREAQARERSAQLAREREQLDMESRTLALNRAERLQALGAEVTRLPEDGHVPTGPARIPVRTQQAMPPADQQQHYNHYQHTATTNLFRHSNHYYRHSDGGSLASGNDANFSSNPEQGSINSNNYALSPPMSDAASVLSDNSNTSLMMDSIDAAHSETSSRRSFSTAGGSRASRIRTSGVAFDFGCKMCHKRSCLSIVHLQQASQLSLAANLEASNNAEMAADFDHRTAASITEGTDAGNADDRAFFPGANFATTLQGAMALNNSSNTNNNINVHNTTNNLNNNGGNGNFAPLHHQQNAGFEPQAQTAEVPNAAANNGENAEFDQGFNAGTTFGEISGLSGPITLLFQNAAALLSCNLAFLHSFVFVPFIIGQSMSSGKVLYFSLSLWDFLAEKLARALELSLSASVWNSMLVLKAKQMLLHTFDWTAQLVAPALGKYAPMDLQQAVNVMHAYWNVLHSTLAEYLRMIMWKEDSFGGLCTNILLGYSLISVVLYLYVKGSQWLNDPAVPFTNGHAINPASQESMPRQMAKWIIFCGLFLKLVICTATQMVVFPFFVGWLIDIWTLDLFGAGLHSRVLFYQKSPLTSIVIHWGIGVIFSIYASLFVGKCREHLRPGLLYFIRNPTDPDFRPVRDMLEKPLAVQFYRLGLTAVVYAMTCYLIFGLFTRMVCLACPEFAPILLNFDDPFSEIPLDLLLQAGLRLVIHWLQPASVGTFLGMLVKVALRGLRLSSYFFGGRFLPEESFPRKGSWRFVPDHDRVYPPGKISSMFTRSVEPQVVARLTIREGHPPSMTTASAPDANGSSSGRASFGGNGGGPRRPRFQITRHPSRLGYEHDGSNPYKGFTVVFRPHYMVARVIVFMAFMWAIAQACMFVSVVLPTLIGRRIFSALLHKRMHEVYAYGIGLFAMAVTTRLLTQTAMFVARFDRRSLGRVVLKYPILALKVAYLTVAIGIVWPFLTGLYLILLYSPILSDFNQTPIIPLLTAWSFGLPLAKIMYALRARIFSASKVEIMDQLGQNSLATLSSSFGALHTKLIIPCFLRMLALLTVPPLVVLLACPLFNASFAQMLLLQRFSYSFALLVPVLWTAASAISSLYRRLLGKIRDEAYLVGRQLHNLEQQRP